MKTRLNLGVVMGMNHWEWEGMGLKKSFPLISSWNTCRYHVTLDVLCVFRRLLRNWTDLSRCEFSVYMLEVVKLVMAEQLHSVCVCVKSAWLLTMCIRDVANSPTNKKTSAAAAQTTSAYVLVTMLTVLAQCVQFCLRSPYWYVIGQTIIFLPCDFYLFSFFFLFFLA